MFTPMLLGTALFLYVMEMWARTHPDPALLRGAPMDTVEWVDRFEVRDSGAAIPSVERYIAFVAQSGSNGGLIHNYINRGLRILNHAMWGVSGMNVRVGETDRMQHALARYIDTLEAHPRWALDPHKVVPAFLMACEVLESQNASLDADTRRKIDKARETALGLMKGPSTLWQRGKVQDFFIRAGIALVAVKSKAGHPPDGGPRSPALNPDARPQARPHTREPDPQIPVPAGKQKPPTKLIFGNQ